MDASMRLLGGMTPARFLAEHWQKKPLLVRAAVPGFAGLVSPAVLCSLAARDDAVSRLVTVGPKGRHTVEQGPLRGKRSVSPERAGAWSVLVQAAENHVAGAWDLLGRFGFLPTARIDDLMISYATKDGGVGPHFDQYDVFLLQGEGRRRWRISTDPRVLAGSRSGHALPPFAPTDDWVLEPGDMLYLPPRVAHWGTAVEACTTYSIGLLAPTHEQIIGNFAGYLSQRTDADGMYADPDLALQEHPAEITDATLARVVDALRVGEFWGRFLTGPKPGVRFARARGAAASSPLARVALARPSRMLFRGDVVFLNGEAFAHDASDASRAMFRTLADTRRADATGASAADLALLRTWRARGWLVNDNGGA